MRYLLLALPCLLSACASDNCPPPAVQIKTVERVVEVQRPCAVTQPPLPAPLARPLPTDAVALAAMLAKKLVEWAGPGGYGERAASAIGVCTKP